MQPLPRALPAMSALVVWFAPGLAQAATVLHFSQFTSGTGQHTVNAVNYPVIGVMSTTVPRFNGLLGTLIQADFEFAGTANGAWQADPGFSGAIDFIMTGPVDVGGQPMGNFFFGFAGSPINDQTPIPYASGAFANATFTSGAFFNSLTGVGNETLTWNYSGTTSVSVPAIGIFDWGGSAHVLYTYIPVPEPSALVLCGLGAACWFLAFRRRR